MDPVTDIVETANITSIPIGKIALYTGAGLAAGYLSAMAILKVASKRKAASDVIETTATS
jgi:hypothetical protein